ncbi:MAG: HNH endonuclease [Candidatus Promineofilum sp.]|nr:HNH endonuclease [Promineifilum sp.]
MSFNQIPLAVRQRVQQAAADRCGYCLSPQALILGRLEIDHIIPTAKGGTNDEENLWMACSLCNNYKGSRVDGRDPLTGETVSLFNPRQERWSDHFRWNEDGTLVEGITPVGRTTIAALQLNNVLAITVRRGWVKVGWHPPD